MRSIIDYVKKFGNQSFEEFAFNEVDSLILSQITYLNLDDYVPSIDDTNQPISLLGVLDDDTIYKLSVGTLDERRNKILLHMLKKSTRYEGLNCGYFSNLFHVDKIQQFCAITFLFSKFSYVAYRGTDLTLLGWKENFNMAFLDVIPSQTEASKYLNRICKYISTDLYIGGHSKGGNLAVYAALYSEEKNKGRFLHIFNHDGPGFLQDISQMKEYKQLESKISKTTCKEAMVGIMLHHSEKMTFVDSRGLSIFQHDPFNWKITKDGRFKLVKHANFISKAFEKTVNDFIETTSIEKRKRFLEILFKVVMEDENSTIFDFTKHPFESYQAARNRYKLLTQREQLFFKSMLKRYRKIWRHNFKIVFMQRKNQA